MASVLIVAPYATWTPNWETDLELAQRHIDDGDRVTLLVCTRQLAVCDPNPDHKWAGCLRCVARQRRGLKLLSGALRVEGLPTGTQRTDRTHPEPRTIADLVQLRIDSFDIGWAVLSSLVSWQADPEPDLNDRHVGRLMRTALAESANVYRGMRQRLRAEKVDVVYVFNGRLSVTRAVVRACEAEGVSYRTHDRGCDHEHYQVYENRLPHDLAGLMTDIRAAWAGAKDPERTAIADSFYADCRAGISHSWVPYTDRQAVGRLPDVWQRDKTNIVAFLSSEDEFVAIGEEWRNPIYRSQADGLRQIVRDLRGEAGCALYIRMHPNQIRSTSEDVRAIRALASDTVQVIEPDSAVSSYAMLDAADKVLSFGSTMGIEAAYWGKPSVVAGRSAFKDLGSTYEPLTHAAVLEALVRKNLKPLPRLGALMYGYYERTRGERFRHYQGLDVWDGLFKGQRVTPGPLRALSRLRHLLVRA